jgi:hypothetical protein
LADAIHMLQPSDTDPLPHPQAHYIAAGFVHSPDNLMAGNDGRFVKREIAFDNVNVGAANCANAHFYPDLTSPGPAARPFLARSAAPLPRPSVLSGSSRA